MVRRTHGIGFREARPGSHWENLASTFGQASVMWVFLYVLFPAAFYRLEGAVGLGAYRFSSPFWRSAGVAVFTLAACLNVVSAVFMAVRGRGTPLPSACARELVVTGPYRYVRNPMALTSVTQIAALGLFLGSPLGPGLQRRSRPILAGGAPAVGRARPGAAVRPCLRALSWGGPLLDPAPSPLHPIQAVRTCTASVQRQRT